MEPKKKPTDYGDGSHLTHYQGNDDYPNGANWPDEKETNEDKLDGKVASGNQEFPEDLENELRDMYP